MVNDVSEPAPSVPPKSRHRSDAELSPWWWVLAFFGVIALYFLFHTPSSEQGLPPRLMAKMHGKEIAVALFVYARNHGGKYPEGSSSTEVFQKLLDEGFIESPTIFYVAMPGKVRADPSQKVLKPENVSFDMTYPPDFHLTVHVPLIFLTGYRVKYDPGAAATPEIKPHPEYGRPSWFFHSDLSGITVAYNDTKSAYLPWADDFTIPNFVPSDFKSDGTDFHQLTPDGPMQ